MCPPMCQKAVLTKPTAHPDKAHGASEGLANFMRDMTEATYNFEDGVEAERKALRADKVALRADNATLRADNAALTVRLEVATKTVKRAKALAVKYYDLCATSGVDAEVLHGVEEAELSDEEAEESDE